MIRWAIVGAGPHGLTVAAHLVRAGVATPDELTVIDPAGRWLAAWRRAFQQFGIDRLRSPVVHHPDPEPYALVEYARASGRGDELHGRYQTPNTRLFDDFCDDVVERTGLSDRVTAGVVTEVTADGSVTWTHAGRGGDRAATTLRADHVVLAHQPRRAIVPRELHDRPATHAADTDLDAVGPHDHVVVIGGGLTAGHLACGAAERGATVTLVTRRGIEQREFDTDPGWLGPREMRGFLATRSFRERRDLAIAARGGGTMPAWMHRRLVELERNGSISRSCEPAGVPLDEHLARVAPGATHTWCATGWEMATSDDPLVAPLARSTRTVGELLVLGERLDVPGTAVHVIGRPAMLHLGPTAGNLAGARRAAAALIGVDDALG